MAIAHSATVTGSAGASSGSVASASVTNTSGLVYILYVCWRRSGGAPTISTVAGMGLTWTHVDTQCGARDQLYHSCYRAVGDGGSSGAVTVTFSANTNGAVVSVSSYSGCNTTTPVPVNASYNTLGVDGACSGGTDNDDATGSITTSLNNSYVIAGFATRNRTLTATGSFSTRVNDVTGGTGGDLQTLSVEDILKATAGAQTCGAANNLSGTADWSLIMVELAEAVAAGGGMPQIIVAMDAHRAIFGG